MKAKRKKRLSMQGRHIAEAYVFMTPLIIGILCFFAFPIGQSLWLSLGKLTSVSGLKVTFAGLDNYVRAFMMDLQFVPLFLESVRTTLIRAPLILVFSLIIAILINQNIRGRGLFRTIFFLPFLLGNGFVMQQLTAQGVDLQALSVQQKLLGGDLFAALGPGLSDGLSLFFSSIVLVLWSSGVQILLFLSGLQSISPSLYESARVDSATPWECFWHITLPMLTPILLLNIIYTLVDSFTSINDGLLQYIKQVGFEWSQFDFAAAMGWIYFLFILLLVLITFAVMSRFIYSADADIRRKDR